MREAETSTTRAVLVTATEPEPRSFGKQVVLGGLLDQLCARLGPQNVHVVLVGRAEVQRLATAYELHVISKPSALEQFKALVGRVLSPPHSSLQEAALWSPRVLEELRSLIDSLGADLEIWDTMRAGQYAKSLPRRRRVLYADDLFSKRYASMLNRIERDDSEIPNPLGQFGRLLPRPAAWLASQPRTYRWLLRFEQARTARSEVESPQHFDATYLVNVDETTELIALTGSTSIHTIMPLLPEPAPRPRCFDGTPTFVFLGGLDFAPNRDGLSWFLKHCRELVLSAIPQFRLLIVGRSSTTALPEAEAWGDHVQELGWVDDLDDVLLGAAAMISPLCIGSGTKIKVLEALSRGLPVVATPHGVLGLQVGREDGCLVADSPAEFAALLKEPVDVKRNRVLSIAAKNSWATRFAPDIVADAYNNAFGLGRADGERAVR